MDPANDGEPGHAGYHADAIACFACEERERTGHQLAHPGVPTPATAGVYIAVTGPN